MKDDTKTLIVRTREFADDSVSLITFPSRFEVTADFMDDGGENGEKAPATSLYFEVTFNAAQSSDFDYDELLTIDLYPKTEVPEEFLGEFVVDEEGIDIIAAILDFITDDIADHLCDADGEGGSCFDIDDYTEQWTRYLDCMIRAALRRIRKQEEESEVNDDEEGHNGEEE